MDDFSSGQLNIAKDNRVEARSPESKSVVGPLATLGMTGSRPIILLIVCGIALVAAIVLGTAITIFNSRDRALAGRERELQNIALILADQTDRVFEAAERVQINLIERMQALGIGSGEDFERKMSGYDIHLMLKDKIVGLPHIGTFTLINAQGKLFNFSRFWPIPTIDVADRDFFKAFQSNEWRTFFISKPIHNRATGTWVLQIARKVPGPKGEFIGLVLATIELQSFEQFFSSIALEPGSSISLFHRDGELLARYPRVDTLIGSSFGANALFMKLVEHSNLGVGRQKGVIDSEDRLIAAHTVAHYPFVVVVTTTIAAALVNWRNEAKFLIGAGGLAALMIAAVVLVIVRQLLQSRKWFQQELGGQRLQLKTALNNMSQGLLMFDSSARIVVCNQRYIEMYGLSPEVVKPGLTLRELIEHRKETGSLRGDPEQYCSEILTAVAQGNVTCLSANTTDGRTIDVVSQPMANGGWVATHEDVTERRQADEQLKRVAHYDQLTGLPNRLSLQKELGRLLAGDGHDGPTSIALFDLDGFKDVNDTLGHTIGDELLIEVGERLMKVAQDHDQLSRMRRLGGDEFVAVFPNCGDPRRIDEIVASMLNRLAEPFHINDHVLHLGASSGIAIAPNDGSSVDELIGNADLALYQAKSGGGRTHRFFLPVLRAQAQARRDLDLELRRAFAEDEFEIYFQPQIRIADHAVVGAEALLRWRHPTKGILAPGAFIETLANSPIARDVSKWILREACERSAAWRAIGLPLGRIGVNLFPNQLHDEAMLKNIEDVLQETGLPAEVLELEITENVALDHKHATLTLLKLREKGMRLAFDDFGTGYASLSSLTRFPVSRIKIDRSFVGKITSDADAAAIVRSLIAMAHNLGLEVIAEGVETSAQATFLLNEQCEEAQGFLYSKPLPAIEFEGYLKARQFPLEAKAAVGAQLKPTSRH